MVIAYRLGINGYAAAAVADRVEFLCNHVGKTWEMAGIPYQTTTTVIADKLLKT